MTKLRLDYKCTFLILLFLVVSCSVLPTHPTTPPTLSPTHIANIVSELYMNNGGCKLPCLLGIVPKQTSIQDVYSRFSRIGDFEDQTRVVDTYQNIAFVAKSPPDGIIGSFNDNRWGFSMRVKNDIVVGFVTGATDIKKFSVPSLSKFLSYFGQPEEIWIRIIGSMLIDENPDYEIALYYPSKGIFIRWRENAITVLSQTKKSITVTACPQYLPTYSDTAIGLYPPFFYLFSPDETLPFDEIINTHLSEDSGGSYHSLSAADVKKFYTTYRESNTQDCFPFSSHGK
jgi:hypothetical protein